MKVPRQNDLPAIIKELSSLLQAAENDNKNNQNDKQNNQNNNQRTVIRQLQPAGKKKRRVSFRSSVMPFKKNFEVK